MFAAFVGAQLFSALAGQIADAVFHPGAADLSFHVVPAMLASELALVLVSLVTPLLAWAISLQVRAAGPVERPA